MARKAFLALVGAYANIETIRYNAVNIALSLAIISLIIWYSNR